MVQATRFLAKITNKAAYAAFKNLKPHLHYEELKPHKPYHKNTVQFVSLVIYMYYKYLLLKWIYRQ